MDDTLIVAGLGVLVVLLGAGWYFEARNARKMLTLHHSILGSQQRSWYGESDAAARRRIGEGPVSR